MFGKASVLLVLGLALGACGDTHGMKSQGQTHWLVQCESDADCGELSCECGVCVVPCDSAGECSVEGVSTQCFQRGSGAVRALCGDEHDVPLCLQACDDDCGEGQSCQANACVPNRSPGPDASMDAGDDGPDGSTGLPGPDGGYPLPELDAGSIPEPPSGTLTIGLRNESSNAVVLFVGDCTGRQRWFDVRENGEELAVTHQYACDCRSPGYQERGCSYGPAVCQDSVFESLEPSGEKIYTWDTGHWYPRTDTPCSYRWPVEDGGELNLRACWLREMPLGDDLSYPDDFECASTTFTLDSRTGSRWLTIAD